MELLLLTLSDCVICWEKHWKAVASSWKHLMFLKEGFESCQFLHFVCAVLISIALSLYGWRPKERSLMTGSLNSCDQLGTTGWGKLMCNSLLLSDGYWHCAIEQGSCCISGGVCQTVAMPSRSKPLEYPCRRKSLLAELSYICWATISPCCNCLILGACWDWQPLFL